MASPSGSPVAALERFVALDALRGIALFGVLRVNVDHARARREAEGSTSRGHPRARPAIVSPLTKEP